MKSFKRNFFTFLLIITSFSAGFAVSDFVKNFSAKSNIRGLINFYNFNGENVSDDSSLNSIWSVLNNGKSSIDDRADFSVFWDAWNMIENKYTTEPLDYQNMVYGAVSGMVDSLEDPYTIFFTPQDLTIFEQDLKGSFSGIGAEIGFRDKLLTIIAPLKDSPAEKAGIIAGDKILKVDDREIISVSIDEAVSLIRGEQGTVVKLLISRENVDKLMEINVTRDIIKINTVEWEGKIDNIVYIKISQFSEKTSNEFDNQIDDILLMEPSGIIVDLRNNPGGYVSTLENIASKFLKKGDVIFVEDFGKKQKSHLSNGSRKFGDIPIVVLINEGSASASEIFAGALRDNNGSTLIGKQTFGKGLVQEMQNLKDGSALKITVARWLTPNGHDINKNGIDPDIEIEFTQEDYENEKDPQLDRAIEFLSEQKKN
ncbi:S41 family peptidase [Patescibacteria group bacterium]|nr:S41 family peptidase [Patescibacteria group bacterium]